MSLPGSSSITFVYLRHLDISATEWLEGFLKKFDGGAMIVSHDRYFLDRVSTRVTELENRLLTERSGTYTSFME